MSGHKHATVSISQEEYRRLHDAEMKLRFMQEDMPKLVETVNREVNSSLQQGYVSLEAHHNEFLNALHQVDEGIYNLEQSTSQALMVSQVDFENRLSELAGQLVGDTQSLFEYLSFHTQSTIQSWQEDSRQALRLLQQQMNQTVLNQQQIADLAEQWLKAAGILDEFILQKQDDQHYSPGRLQHIENQLVLSQSNFSAGMYEAALISSQQVYLDLSDLRLEIEKQQAETLALTQSARISLIRLQQLAASNRHCPAIDLDGNELPIRIDVNYWVYGAYDDLRQEIDNHLRILEQTPDSINIHDLRGLIEETIPAWESTLSDQVYLARTKVINAQLRMNITEIVVKALFGQGYALQESNYISEDMRQPYYARVCNYEGSEVLIQVDPASQNDGESEMHLFASDTQMKTEHELNQRALEISRTLQQDGYLVGTIHAEPIRKQAPPKHIDKLPKVKQPSLPRSRV